MDIGYGYSNRPQGFLSKAKLFNSRLTNRSRAVIGIVILFIFYKFFNPFSTKLSEDYEDFSTGIEEDESVAEEVQDLIDDRDINLHPINYLTAQKPFVDTTTFNLFNYDYGGNMMISQTADYIRLVPEKQHQVGYMFSNLPISLEDSGSFEIEIEFRIHGEQVRTNMIGDGAAIWLTSQPLEQGDVFGVQSDYHGLGIFLDTYKNSGAKRRGSHGANSFPYVSIQPNDGQVGKYDKSTDGEFSEIGGCPLRQAYNVKKGTGYSKMKIIYLRSSGYFQIDFDLHGTGVWKNCFTTEDLGRGTIPETPFLGISAETGELFHNIDIKSVHVNAMKDREGQSITSIDALIDRLEKQNAGEGQASNEDDEAEDASRGGKSRNSKNRRTSERIAKRRHRRLQKKGRPARERKSAARLKNAERRAKLKDAEKYGDERGFVGWFFGLVWAMFKFSLYMLLVAIIGYFAFLGYRIYREKKRKSMSRGLL